MLVTILSKSVEYSLLAVVDPHFQVSRGQSSRPWDNGGAGSPKRFFWPFGPQFGLKIRGRRGSLLWICHWVAHPNLGSGNEESELDEGPRTSTKRNAIWTYGVFRMFFETFKFAAILAFFLRKFQHNYWNKCRVREFFLHFTNWNCS